MNIVMLSGGSGQRLWPLSNNVRSKQFLKLLKNDDNELESMVQRVYRQLENVHSDSNIVIATSDTQVESVRAHLGDKVEIVVEPERRDTFPAIVLSVAHLYYNSNLTMSDTVVVMPVDPYTSDEFFHKIAELNEKIQESEKYNLGLLGIEPTYASSKYGYIMNDNQEVTGFVEKPTEEIAKEIIAQGAYWNGGVFVMKIGYILNILERYIDFESFDDVLRQYDKLPKNSFDYEVSEKEDKITMVKYTGYWKDLGTWKTLTEEMDTETLGKVTMSEDSNNTHVINAMDIPITVIGTSDLVIAASQDGILVSDKVKSAKLKDYITGGDQLAMYQERYYGSRKIIDIHNVSKEKQVISTMVYMNQEFEIEYSSRDDEFISLTIIEGEALLIQDEGDSSIILMSGDVFRIENGVSFSLEARTELKFLEIRSIKS